MPIYEYKCQSCKKTLEFIQKFSDPVLTECPECHGILEKLVSSPHFELKGTGWYVTDFKNADKKAEPDKPSEETKTSSETGEKPSTPVEKTNETTSSTDSET